MIVATGLALIALSGPVSVADRYWDDRAVAPACPTVATYAANEIHDPENPGRIVPGYAEPWNCVIVVDRWYLQRPMRRTLCKLVIHEVGHLRGLGHDAPFAVMRGEGSIPRVCMRRPRMVRL